MSKNIPDPPAQLQLITQNPFLVKTGQHFSTAGSVSSLIDSEVENKEFKTAFDAFLLYFGKSMKKQKIFANGKKTIKKKKA